MLEEALSGYKQAYEAPGMEPQSPQIVETNVVDSNLTQINPSFRGSYEDEKVTYSSKNDSGKHHNVINYKRKTTPTNSTDQS